MLTRKRITKALRKWSSRAAIRAKSKIGARKAKNCSACSSYVVDFFGYGDVREWGCPECGASPRERLVNYALERELLTVPIAGTILHVAPGEQSLVRRFQNVAAHYVAADLDPGRYAVPGIKQVDLMEMRERAKYDLIYASHVMEHVPKDRLVLANLLRALRPGGQAWLMVPLHDAPTIEGGLDMAPRLREEVFGQWDHIRQYGIDFCNRLEEAGFCVHVLNADNLPAEERMRHGLADVIFIASAPYENRQRV